ncbi:MAG: S8 family serine peptidase [Planctomycetota bacterium]
MAQRRYIVLKSDTPQYAGTLDGLFGISGPTASMRGPREDLSVDLVDLSRADLLDLERNPSVKAVAPPMPVRLIEPASRGTDGPVANPGVSTWGIRAVGADASPLDGSGVAVAVLDTGIDLSHAAFSGMGNIERMNFTPDGPDDVDGHGTHVAGTIFGRDVNGTRIGVARGIEKALVGKVLDDNGSGSTDRIYEAILWADQAGADIISMSLGFDFPGFSARLIAQGFPEDLATSIALEAYRANVRLFDALAESLKARALFDQSASLCIAASGNESHREMHPDWVLGTAPPAAADGFVSVGALGKKNPDADPMFVAPFSNTGVTVSAPGVDVVSAQVGSGNGLVSFDGTSMATPHVAGVAALWAQRIKQQTGTVQHGRLMGRLLGNAQALTELDSWDVGLGIVRAPQQ